MQLSSSLYGPPVPAWPDAVPTCLGPSAIVRLAYAGADVSDLTRSLVARLQGPPGHLSGRVHSLAAVRAQVLQGLVQVHQPGAAYRPLGRRVAVALLQNRQHVEFALRLRGQRDMAALARQRHTPR